MDQQQAKFLAQYLTTLWEGEFKATCRVIAAVPDEQRSYRPDEKSRNAWELATHLASGDIWFLQSIIDGKFVWDPDAAKKSEGRFTSVREVVDYYKQAFPEKLAEVRAMPAGKLTGVVDFFGFMQMPNVHYLGFANNHSMHHRGQLAAYLRAMGSKVPAIYGASADEPVGAA
jgi:uncharacterized damage-inducible protein DinB